MHTQNIFGDTTKWKPEEAEQVEGWLRRSDRIYSRPGEHSYLDTPMSVTLYHSIGSSIRGLQ